MCLRLFGFPNAPHPQDTTVERDYVAEYVFPDVERRLRDFGFTFDVVDLRWCMNDAFGDNHCGA